MPTPFSYKGSTPRPVLSVFSSELLDADKAAYCALLSHLSRFDSEYTVIMVQVENEVGLLGTSRDRSLQAQAAWEAPMPPELCQALLQEPTAFHPDVAEALLPAAPSGQSWATQFDEGNSVAEEAFMAWAFASYVHQIASAGKEIHSLPTYANAWLGPQPGQDLPGNYPSGGPTERMLKVWQCAAPSLDFLAPDIYVQNSTEVMAQYARAGNPLFIPEARFKAGDAFLAVGLFGGFGYHAFGLEDGRDGNQFGEACRALLALTNPIVEAQRDGTVFGFALDPEDDEVSTTLGECTVTVRNAHKLYSTMLLDAGVRLPPPPELPSETDAAAHGPTPGDGRPFGIVVAEAPLEFLVVGQGALFDFSLEGADLEVDSVRELRLTDDGWQEGRLLNGDERLQVLQTDKISAARITLLKNDQHSMC